MLAWFLTSIFLYRSKLECKNLTRPTLPQRQQMFILSMKLSNSYGYPLIYCKVTRVLDCLALKDMQAFSDCLWRGNLIVIYGELLGKSCFPNCNFAVIQIVSPDSFSDNHLLLLYYPFAKISNFPSDSFPIFFFKQGQLRNQNI